MPGAGLVWLSIGPGARIAPFAILPFSRMHSGHERWPDGGGRAVGSFDGFVGLRGASCRTRWSPGCARDDVRLGSQCSREDAKTQRGRVAFAIFASSRETEVLVRARYRIR